MVTNNQEPSRLNRGSSTESGQLKELLDKTQIRTMQKDIVKLRQAGVLQEKISKINPVKSALQSETAVPNKEQFNGVRIPIVPTLPNTSVKDEIKKSSTLDKIEAVINKENAKTPIAEPKQKLSQESGLPKGNQNLQKLESSKEEQSIKQEQIKSEETKKKESEEASIKKAQEDSEEKNKIQSQQQATSLKTKEKEYLKGVPLAAKAKLQKSAEIEEKQRRKFMEDVEKWAEEKKDDNISNN